MKTGFIIFFTVLSFGSFSQETDKVKNFHFGVMTQLIASSAQKNGLNFSLFGDFKKHQVAIGSRYNFMNPNRSNFHGSSKKTEIKATNLDFHYRYYFLNKGERFKTFAQFTGEVNFVKEESTFFAEPSTEQISYGTNYSYSFNAKGNYNKTYLACHLGIGEEIRIVKGLFATIHLGCGFQTTQTNESILDMDSKTTFSEFHKTYSTTLAIAYTGSLGIGYRF